MLVPLWDPDLSWKHSWFMQLQNQIAKLSIDRIGPNASRRLVFEGYMNSQVRRTSMAKGSTITSGSGAWARTGLQAHYHEE